MLGRYFVDRTTLLFNASCDKRPMSAHSLTAQSDRWHFQRLDLNLLSA